MENKKENIKLALKSMFITLAVIVPVFFSVYFFAVLLPLIRASRESAAEAPQIPLPTNSYNLLLGVYNENAPLCACLVRFDSRKYLVSVCSLPADYLADNLFSSTEISDASCYEAASELERQGNITLDGWLFMPLRQLVKLTDSLGPFVFTVSTPLTVTGEDSTPIFRMNSGSTSVGGEMCANIVQYASCLPQQQFCELTQQLAVSALTQYGAQGTIPLLNAYTLVVDESLTNINTANASTLERTAQLLFSRDSSVAGVSVLGSYTEEQLFLPAYPILHESFGN